MMQADVLVVYVYNLREVIQLTCKKSNFVDVPSSRRHGRHRTGRLEVMRKGRARLDVNRDCFLVLESLI